ncbi:MAG: DegT/DnrJ/EryC1/StrS family aminotransferase [Sumerlaeia bacterium]
MEWKVPLSNVTIDHQEVDAVSRVLKSGWLTMGPEVKAFEQEFAKAIGTKHAMATANATDALALCYDAVSVGDRHKIAMCALTFVASMNVALRRNETPLLIDITSEDDLCMSVDDLNAKMSDDVGLIVTMPYAGYAPKMDEILQIAKKRNIPVIEDACHGILGEYKGRMLGSLGDAGVFSFYGNKNMTTGEGGMVTTNDDAIAERIRLMRNHGMTRSTMDHFETGISEYDVVVAGHNFRMDEMRAAVGRIQLQKLPTINKERREVSAKLKKAIYNETTRVYFPFSSHNHDESSHHLLVMLLPKGTVKKDFVRRMNELGVQTSYHYKPLHRFSHTIGIIDDKSSLPVLESIEKRLVSLPLFPGMTDEQINFVSRAVAQSI